MKKNKLLFLATLSTACLLSLASCQGAQGPKGDQGEPGINGTNGTNGKDGEKGEDGNSVKTGKGAPAQSLGKDGDSYIDTESFDFYVKADGKWSKEGNIKGASGDAGNTGEDGTSIRNGKGAPADTLGNDGDCYIDLSTFDFYVKADGKWSKEGNIKGEKGDQGEKGDKGDKGWNGSQGSQGKDGATAWSNTILPSQNGYVTVDVGSAIVGEWVTFTAVGDEPSAANNNTTYDLDEMKIHYKDETGTTQTTIANYSPYKIQMVAGGFVVEASFKDKTQIESRNKVEGKDSNGKTNYYVSIEEAIEAGCTTIALEKDYTLSSGLEINTENKITIDLKGHTLTAGSHTITVSSSVSFITSEANGKIDGGTGTGITVEDTSKQTTDSRNKFSFGGFSTYSRNNVNILANTDNNDSILSIGSGVTVSSTSGVAINVVSGSVALSGKVTTESGIGIQVKGGTLNIDGAAEATKASGVAVSIAQESIVEAKVNVIEIEKDGAKTSGSISNSSTGTAVKVTAGSLNVNAGTVESASGTAVSVEQSVNSEASVKVDGGSVTTSSGKAVEVSAGTVTVSSGKVSATDSGTAVEVSQADENNATSVTVNSGAEVTASTGSAVSVSSGTVTVSGTVKSTGGTAVAVSGGSLTVEGTVEGKENGIKVSNGEVTVSSGTVKAESSTGAAINVESNDGTSEVTVKVEGTSTIKNEDSNGDGTGSAIKQSGTTGSSTVEIKGNTTIKDSENSGESSSEVVYYTLNVGSNSKVQLVKDSENNKFVKVTLDGSESDMKGTLSTAISKGVALDTSINDVKVQLPSTSEEVELETIIQKYSSLEGKNLTLTGTKNGDELVSKYKVHKASYVFEGYENITLEDIYFDFGNADYRGFANGKNYTFNNCTINGRITYCGKAGLSKFVNCKFNSVGDDYSIWTYSVTDYAFETCTFTNANKGKFIKAYGDMNHYGDNTPVTRNITIKDCTFDGTTAAGCSKPIVCVARQSACDFNINFEYSDEAKLKEIRDAKDPSDNALYLLIDNLLGIEDKDDKGGKVVFNVNNVKEFDNSDTSFFNENTLHYYGNGAPSETKADETAYVDTDTFDVYYSNGTIWSKMGNIKSSISD